MARTPTTQHDIARFLSVSQNTVSLALRGSERISPEVRQKVQEAAERLGYSPNFAGLAMVTGRLNSLALVIGTDPDRSSLSLDLLQGVLDGAVAGDRHVQVAKLSDATYADERVAPRLLRELSADGLLINYGWGMPPELDRLVQRHQLPAIWLNALREHDCVRPDDRGAGRQAAQQLLAAGARRLAWVDFSMSERKLSGDQHYSYRMRAEGFRAAADEAGIAAKVIRPPADVPYQEYQGLADQLVDTESELDGFAVNTRDTAVALLMALRARGRSPGAGLAMIVVADRPAWALCGGLQTLLVPQHAMGRRAVEVLLARIERSQERLPTEVIPFGFYTGGDDLSRGTDVSGARSQ